MKTSDTVIGKNRCVTCDREKATLRCGGCLQEFCFNHLTDHRQELRKQLDDIIATRDVFQQTLNEQRNDLEKHALIGKINEWERVSIKTIQQTAEEERQKVYKYASVHRRQIKFDPNKLSEQLGQSREENDIDDTNIRDWNEELNRLAKELIKPLCIKLELDTTPLINAISVNMTPKLPAPSSNWNSNRGSSFGSRSSRGGSSGGFGSRNGDSGGSGFSGRGGRGGFGVGGGGFGSNNNVDSHRCYKCNQTGHMSRECQEPRKENRSDHSCFSSNGSRGGFDSDDSDDHNINFIPESNDGPASRSVNFGNSRNQNNSDSKPSFGNWRKSATSNSNDSEDVKNSSTFGKSESRGGFNRRGGFRGGRGGGGGGFSLGDRGGRGGDSGGGNSGKCYNCDQFGHQSRDCPEERKPREGGSSSFFSAGGGGDGAGRRSDRVSDDIFDQASGRANGQPMERYIPPPAPLSEDDIFGEAVSKDENFGKYHRTQIQCTPESKIKPIKLYEEANLSAQILSNIRRAHFEQPTSIQCYTIPCIQQRDDIMACAHTGSGKTAAFLLPIVSNLLECHSDELMEKTHPPAPLCLILSPTRELALQTEREARKFSYQTAVIPCSAVGGHDMYTVSDRLKEGCHILSATAGRLKDMVEKGRVSLKHVKYFVLDEADRMLDTGFESDIRKLEELGLPPKDERCTSMFSATFPDEERKLAKYFLRDNYIFLVDDTMGGTNEHIAQTIEEVRQRDKKDRLLQLLEQDLSRIVEIIKIHTFLFLTFSEDERCLIFVETNRQADYTGALLAQKKIMTTTMHDDRTQRQRTEAVQQFTNGKYSILVATSVVARGLDFPSSGYVVNYDLPDSSDFYIHRIGRTGRAGHLGRSISFFDPKRDSDRRIAPELILKLTEAGQEVPDFLRQYSETSNSGFSRDGYSGRNTNMRSRGNSSDNPNQAANLSGRTSSASSAEVDKWD
ncbi:unnamed protein product [Adineta steineri]|uniref:RNA helicase n=1 Tax=Adineta steineri TaxID=433720 RepID=A0A813N8X2_9BILA|nr:unnamed protein product [Adineta steineri]